MDVSEAKREAVNRALFERVIAAVLAEHVLMERDLQAPLLGGPDFMEGVAAFREKRPPRFEGE